MEPISEGSPPASHSPMEVVNQLIQDWSLEQHPEGGWFRELYRSGTRITRADGQQRAAITSILYLQGAEQGGELYMEREKGEEREVKSTKGTLFTFTSGEENRHRVAEVTEGVRVALTIFFTCDQDFHLDL